MCHQFNAPSRRRTVPRVKKRRNAEEVKARKDRKDEEMHPVRRKATERRDLRDGPARKILRHTVDPIPKDLPKTPAETDIKEERRLKWIFETVSFPAK